MKFTKGPIISALALALAVAGIAGTTAFAASTPGNTAPATAPTATQQVEKAEPEQNQTTLLAQAKITEAEAIKAAEAAHSGYTFTLNELDSEDGVVVYELKGSDSSGQELKVDVNALDGSVLAQQADNEEHQNENGGQESAQDQAALAAQAKITEAEAIKAAEAAHSGYTFTLDELDSENGVVVYDLKGADSQGGQLEVKVNAADATVMQQEADND